ncbi:MAG: adenylate/guanylate cyclase domain-containing protein [bacterium]
MLSKRPLIIGLFFGCIVSLILTILLAFPFYGFLELKAFDMLFLARGHQTVSDDIIIVAIDNESLGWLEKWPWPRTYHANLTKRLKAAGAKVIAFDILFDSTSSLDPRHDEAFAMAMSGAKNVVLASSIIEKETPGQGLIRIYQLPIPLYLRSAYAAGIVNPPRDPDGFIRRYNIFELSGEEGTFSPSFALEILAKFFDMEKGKSIEALKGHLGKLKFNSKDFMLNYNGGINTFKTVPYNQVLDNSIIERNPAMFRNKIVLVGATATELHDLFGTPFSLAMPGVEIHATAVDTMLHNKYIVETPKGLWIFLVLLTGLITGSLILTLSPLRSLLATIAVLLGYLILVIILFRQNIWLPALTPSLSIFLTYVLGTAYRFATEEAEKWKIRKLFSKYVSKSVVEEIMKDPNKVKLGGHREKMTILFSDIRNFTTLSEKLNPEEVVAMLNEYFTVMNDIIFKYEGTLDKYIGDAIMASFGVPVPHHDDALRAVKTAFEMQQALASLRQRWTFEGSQNFDIGVGINTGEAVAGNIGSEQRLEYTVIGDAVNLASRLESLNKEYKTHILISEFTYEEVRDKIEAKFVADVKVKGKTKAVGVYQVLGIK